MCAEAPEEIAHSENNQNDFFLTREVPGKGVAAFAGRHFSPGEVVIEEAALYVSAVAAPDGGKNKRLWEAIVEEVRSGRLPPSATSHVGPISALRDLGPVRCRQLLLTKTCGPESALPTPKQAKYEAQVLRTALRLGLVPPSVVSFSAMEYARLRKVIRVNGFAFTGDLREGDAGYDVGEAVFNRISRMNHSCAPNLEANVSWNDVLGTLTNSVRARVEINVGDELNISYQSDVQWSVAERRKKLKEHWGFDCDCTRCVAELSNEDSVAASGTVVAEEKGEMSDSELFEAGLCWD
eukprot:TRINITY_DN63445_c0_g1_i1.p1 TRINITY_DN63445_c0_g1~~TRINITY_DN63445_c0_g1_i1.p1  ORF type:complete len:315 (-),score=52.97 TRINITY_DN63445_c0_g1_i1:45-929(-)